MSCVRCGQPLVAGADVCSACGSHHLATGNAAPDRPTLYTPAHLARELLDKRSFAEGERKVVSVLFCDIVGSTALAQRLGPERMHATLNRFFEVALARVHHYEGTVNQFLGDGFMALFGAPIAHEDHELRAVLAALDMVGSVGHEAPRVEHGIADFVVRVGINSGAVVVGTLGDDLRQDYTAIGDVTHVASRLQSLAAPGSILVGEAIYRAVRGQIECRDVGPRNIKGHSGSVPTYQVLRQRSGASPRRAAVPSAPAYAGRPAELALCTSCIDRVAAGAGAILGIVGEAGIGKTRLLEEARRSCAPSRVRWVVVAAVSFGRTLSLSPFLDLLRQCFGISLDDTEDAAHAKLERELIGLFGAGAVEYLPYFATLLTLPVTGTLAERVRYLDGLAMGQQVYRAVRHLCERLAADQPLVLVFEDWHWADQSSRTLLQHLFPLAAHAAILFVVVTRTETPASGASLRETVRGAGLDSRLHEVLLEPLGVDATVALSRNQLGHGELAAELCNVLLPKVGGNPLYLVEILRALVASGAIAWDRASDTWYATQAFDAQQIPATLQGVIMSRIDRLDDDARQALKTAAVIGRAFYYRVMRAVVDHGGDVQRDLLVLQDAALVAEHRLVPELEYTFRHPLIQEAAYEAILSARRRHLHQRVAEATESIFAGQIDNLCALLAYHFARAEDWEKAQRYLLLAGDRAGSIAADAEALEHYGQAQLAYSQVFGDRWEPQQRAMLACRMGEALFRLGRDERAATQFMLSLEQLGTSYPRSMAGVRMRIVFELLRHLVLRWRWRVRSGPPGRSGQMDALMHRLYLGMSLIDNYSEPRRFVLDVLTGLNWSMRAGQPATTSQGCSGVAIMCAVIGARRLSGAYCRQASALAAVADDAAARALADYAASYARFCAGDWDDATAGFERAIATYRAIGVVREYGIALVTLAWLTLWRGDLVRGRAVLAELASLGKDTGDRHLSAWAQFFGSVEPAHHGEFALAIARLREAMNVLIEVPDYPVYVEGLGRLAGYHLRRGEPEQALALLDESSHWIRRKGLVGQPLTCTSLARAWVGIDRAEHAAGDARARHLHDAAKASNAAIRLGRRFAAAIPQGWCTRGTVLWLRGQHRAARRAWSHSVAAAQRIRSVYDLGLVYGERGRLLADVTQLAAARAAFEAAGAAFEMAQVDHHIAAISAAP